MSKEFKNIDELFKSTIGLGGANAPSHIKSNVMSGIGGTNWWIAGAGILLVTSLIGIITIFNSKDLQPSYEARINPETILFTKYAPAITTNKPITALTLPIDKTNKTKETILQSPPLPTKQFTPFVKQKDIQNKPLLQLVQANIKQKNSPLVSKKEVVNKNRKAPPTIKTISHPLPIINEAITAEVIDTVETNSQTTTTLLNINADQQTKSNKVITKIQKANPTSNQNMTASTTLDTSVLIVEQKAVFQIDSSQHIQTDSLASEIEIDITPSPKKGYWMIGAMGGPNINTAKYVNSEFSQTLNKLHNEQLGYFGQVYGQYVANSNWNAAIGLGIESQAYHTTFLTTETNFIYENISVFSHYIYDSLNTIIDTVYNNSIDTVVSTELKNHHGITNCQYIQIPLRFGYQIEKSKWLFGADFGIQLNYLVKSSGTYLQNNVVSPIDNSDILKQMTLNYSIGASVQYNLFNQFYLSGQARFTPAVQNYYQNSYAKRSVNSISLGLGISVKL